jgi:hypothetical protein
MSTLLQTIANFETTISARLTSAGTSLTLTSALDKSGVNIPAGQYGFTINEGKTNEEHVIGTYAGSGNSITSLQRNISRIDGTTTGTGKEHRKNSPIKITNHPLLIRMRRVLDGTDGFDADTPMHYDDAPTFTPGSNQFVTVAYADDLVGSGVASATNSSQGKVKISVPAADVSQPIAVGDNDPRMPTTNEKAALAGKSGTAVSGSNKLIDDADTSTTSSASKVVRLDSAGKIDPAMIKTSKKLYASPSEITLASSSTETTLFSTTIVGGTLGTSNAIKLEVFLSALGLANGGTVQFKLKYGATTIADMESTVDGGSSGTLTLEKGLITGYLVADGATNAQKGALMSLAGDRTAEDTASATTAGEKLISGAYGSATEDSTADKTLTLTAKFNASSADSNLTAEFCLVTLIA